MKAKVFIAFAVVFIVVSFVSEGKGFTFGGGGNIPRKRENEVRQVKVARGYVLVRKFEN